MEPRPEIVTRRVTGRRRVPPARRPGAPGQAGYALILALVVLVLVSAALSLLAASLQFHNESLKRQHVDVNLIALADAALAETLARIAQRPSFQGFAERPFGGGLISSQVEPLSLQIVRVRVTATFGGKTRTVEAEVLKPPDGPQVLEWRRLPTVVASQP